MARSSAVEEGHVLSQDVVEHFGADREQDASAHHPKSRAVARGKEAL